MSRYVTYATYQHDSWIIAIFIVGAFIFAGVGWFIPNTANTDADARAFIASQYNFSENECTAYKVISRCSGIECNAPLVKEPYSGWLVCSLYCRNFTVPNGIVQQCAMSEQVQKARELIG